MAFCNQCGTAYEEGTKFCPSCGAPTAQAPQQPAKRPAWNNTADTTAPMDAADIAQNKTMGILAYISWLVLVPIFAAKQSKFARFHANQGLVLAIAETACGIAAGVLGAILIAISWRLAFLARLLNLVYVPFGILTVLGIVNAATGKTKELPFIGKYKILK